MNRREAINALGVTMAGLAAGKTLLGQDQGTNKSQQSQEPSMQAAEACSDCMNTCNAAFNSLVDTIDSSKKEQLRAVQALMDCADVCGVTARLLARKSEFTGPACDFTTRVCDTAVGQVDKVKDSQPVHDAVAACRRASAACRQARGGSQRAPSGG